MSLRKDGGCGHKRTQVFMEQCGGVPTKMGNTLRGLRLREGEGFGRSVAPDLRWKAVHRWSSPQSPLAREGGGTMNAEAQVVRRVLAAHPRRRALFALAPLLFLLSVGFSVKPLDAQWNGGIVFDRDGLRSFHLAIGTHYGVPVSSVARFSPSWLHPDELPVLYLVAQEARVSPAVVLSLRDLGWSWIEIVRELRVSPAIFVAGLPRSGPISDRNGYWRPRNSRELWLMTDWEIIDFVNLGFWVRAHRRPVEHVVVIRQSVPSWVHYVYVPAPRTVIVQQQIVYTQVVQAPPRVVVPPVAGSTARAGQNQQSTRTVPQPAPQATRPAQSRTIPERGAEARAPQVPTPPAAQRGQVAAPPAAQRANASTGSPVPGRTAAPPVAAPPAAASRTATPRPTAPPTAAPPPPTPARPPVASPPPSAGATRGTAAPPVSSGRGSGAGGGVPRP